VPDKILLVDDEPAVLAGYERLLHNNFQVETAPGGEEALEKLSTKGPFAVVVADMGMPGMDGAQLLAKVMVKFPETIRVMLTGNLDIQTAKRAVNEGCIFRFLTKPCDKETLVNALNAALVQYRVAGFREQCYRAAEENERPEKSATDLALEEAADQVRVLLAKEAKTRLPSTQGGVYTGKAIWIGTEHVVQRISCTIAIAHPRNLLNATPELGAMVRIAYENGQGRVEAVIA